MNHSESYAKHFIVHIKNEHNEHIGHPESKSLIEELAAGVAASGSLEATGAQVSLSPPVLSLFNSNVRNEGNELDIDFEKIKMIYNTKDILVLDVAGETGELSFKEGALENWLEKMICALNVNEAKDEKITISLRFPEGFSAEVKETVKVKFIKALEVACEKLEMPEFINSIKVQGDPTEFELRMGL
jgi:hypothetical protein